MRRYWFGEPLLLEQEVALQDELFAHIFKVCRVQVGEKVELLNSDGAYLVEVLEQSKKQGRVKVKEVREVPPLKMPYLHLALCLPRPSVLDQVVEKSVELGVKSLRLVSSDHSFSKAKSYPNFKRLEKIKLQAMQQSDRIEDMKLLPVLNLDEYLQSVFSLEQHFKFVLYARSNKQPGIPREKGAVCKGLHFLVGPEGGLNSLERDKAVKAGFEELSLGEQVLRVETACVAGGSILKFWQNAL